MLRHVQEEDLSTRLVGVITVDDTEKGSDMEVDFGLVHLRCKDVTTKASEVKNYVPVREKRQDYQRELLLDPSSPHMIP